MDGYGASIERGIVLAAESDGYRVKSLTRDGVVTPPIAAVGEGEYAVGARVYFFVFDDGRGAILGSM